MRPPLRLSLLFALLLFGSACKRSAEEAAPPAPRPPPTEDDAKCELVRDDFGPDGRSDLVAETVVDGLEVPWGLAFLPEGGMLITERPGRLRLFQDGELRATPVATLPVLAAGEGGLMGIALHPSFASNRLFYLAYTISEGEQRFNRVERWRLSEDATSASPDRVILDRIPAFTIHDGGRLRLGPDQKLYLSTGDAGAPEQAQDPTSLAGKLLRFGLDGETPKDNPNPESPVFLYGLRNSQGFDWLDDHTLVLADHGPSGEMERRGLDELNVAKRGDNLGWPGVSGCDSEPGKISPLLSWEKAVPPGGLAVYRSGEIPGWRGSVLLGTLGSRHLHRVVLAPDWSEIRSHEVYFRGDPPEGLGRLREVILGPAGELYLSTSNCDGRGTCPASKDRIVRIRPAAAAKP